MVNAIMEKNVVSLCCTRENRKLIPTQYSLRAFKIKNKNDEFTQVDRQKITPKRVKIILSSKRFC